MAGVYTVKQVNSYIKNMFKQDFLPAYDLTLDELQAK